MNTTLVATFCQRIGSVLDELEELPLTIGTICHTPLVSKVLFNPIGLRPIGAEALVPLASDLRNDLG